MAYCSNCGTKLEDGARFCQDCGTPVENVENKFVDESLDKNLMPDGTLYENGTVDAASGSEAAERIVYESKFTGGAFANAFINWLVGFVSVITLCLARPAMLCWQMRWEYSHTYINGRRLTFDGKGGQLFGKYIVWVLLSVITFGLYYIFCASVAIEKWKASHIHFEDAARTEENKSDFDGKAIGLLGVRLLTGFVTIITLTFGMYWAHCYTERWFCKHTAIDGVRLMFDGRAAQYFGKRVLWTFLTIITCLIYSFWLAVKSKKWTISHTVFDPESELPEFSGAPIGDSKTVKAGGKAEKESSPGKELVIAGFVLTILGYFILIGFIFDIIAVAKKYKPRGLAIAGLVIAILEIVVAITVPVSIILMERAEENRYLEQQAAEYTEMFEDTIDTLRNDPNNFTIKFNDDYGTTWIYSDGNRIQYQTGGIDILYEQIGGVTYRYGTGNLDYRYSTVRAEVDSDIFESVNEVYEILTESEWRFDTKYYREHYTARFVCGDMILLSWRLSGVDTDFGTDISIDDIGSTSVYIDDDYIDADETLADFKTYFADNADNYTVETKNNLIYVDGSKIEYTRSFDFSVYYEKDGDDVYIYEYKNNNVGYEKTVSDTTLFDDLADFNEFIVTSKWKYDFTVGAYAFGNYRMAVSIESGYSGSHDYIFSLYNTADAEAPVVNVNNIGSAYVELPNTYIDSTGSNA